MATMVEPKGRKPGRKLFLAMSVVLALAVVFGVFRMSSDSQRGTRPDIILITLDTLRADRLGFMGDAEARTPYLDKLASEGIVFENAHAHNVVTLPSHANILTGLLPSEHGVHDNAAFTLDEKHTTIAERLKDVGYRTGAFIGAFVLDRRFGLAQGFDEYDDRFGEPNSEAASLGGARRNADEVLAPALGWWGENGDSSRFMWVHLYDPHAPYSPPESFQSDWESDPYRGEIAYLDSALERVLGPILASDDDVLVVITADHGEALGEHGETTHGLFAYEETLKVPLVLWRRNGLEARRVGEWVNHVDIVPTICEVTDIECPATGGSLLEVEGDRDTYFEALSASINRGWAPLTGIISQRHKYIDLPIPELYDLVADPDESSNLIADQRRMANLLREQLADVVSVSASPRDVSPEEREKLLGLGYVTGVGADKVFTEADDPKNLVHVDVLIQRAVSAFQQGDRETASKIASSLVEEYPELKIARAIAEIRSSGSPEMTLEDLEKAVESGKATPEMVRQLGIEYVRADRPEDAERILRPLSGGKDVQGLYAYGVSLAGKGQFADAAEQFSKILETDPTDARAHEYLAVVSSRMGDLEKATVHARRAVEIDPSLTLAYSTLGVIEFKKGNASGAIEAWQKSLETDPRQHGLRFRLAAVAAQSGRRELATRELERFVREAPEAQFGPQIKQARSFLTQLKASAS